MIKFIKNCWNGEERLSVVFWIWGVLVNSILSFLIEIILWPFVFVPLANMQLGRSIESIGYLNILLMIVVISIAIVAIVYEIWVIVSIWRCSWNAKNKYWGWVARMVFILALILGMIDVLFFDEINKYDEELSPGLSEMRLGMVNIPADDKWQRIQTGDNKEDVILLIGEPPNQITLEDGSAVWKYWSKEITNKEDLKYSFTPWGKVYTIYINRSGKVSKKAIENIPKPKITWEQQGAGH